MKYKITTVKKWLNLSTKEMKAIDKKVSKSKKTKKKEEHCRG